MATSHRAERVARVILQELSRLVHDEVRDPRLSSAVFTFHEARMSRDLRHADVYFSVLDGESLPETLKALDRAKGFLRSRLAPVLDIRLVPELRFHVDRSIEEGMRLERLIDEVNRPRNEGQ